MADDVTVVHPTLDDPVDRVREGTRSARYHRRYDTPLLRAVIADPDHWLEPEHRTRLLKEDRTTTVALIGDVNTRWVLKRYNTKNTWHVLRRWLQTSRAQRCWNIAHAMLAADVPTPFPVAMIEERRGPLRGRSYYLAEYVEGETCTAFIDRVGNGEQSEFVFRLIGLLFRRLASQRIAHGDMKATNLVLHRGRLYLVDLDAARRLRSTSRYARAYRRDRDRFLQNWLADRAIYERFREVIPERPSG